MKPVSMNLIAWKDIRLKTKSDKIFYIEQKFGKNIVHLCYISDENKGIRQIGKAIIDEMWQKIYAGISKPNIELTLFKDIECEFCHDKWSALRFTNTEVGVMCPYCVAKSSGEIEYKTLDNIEEYILEEKDQRHYRINKT